MFNADRLHSTAEVDEQGRSNSAIAWAQKNGDARIAELEQEKKQLLALREQLQ